MATLSNDTTGSVSFITVFDGRLVQRVPEGTEGAVSRELQMGANAGKTVWEKTYTSVTGHITGGGIETKEFGGKKIKEIQVKLDDDILLQMPMILLSPFAQILGGIDRTEEVKFAVYKNKKGKTGLNVSQNGSELKWEHTKDNPNGLPSPSYDEDLEEWDFKAHDAFLIKKVKAFFENYSDPIAKVQEEFGGEVVEDDLVPF